METTTSLFAFLFLLLNVCNMEGPIQYEYFTVKVDSVKAPVSAKMTDPVKLEFYRTVGGNGNYSFEKVEIVTKESFTEIRVVGKLNKTAKYGTTVMVELHGLKYSLQPSRKGELVLHIIQPDNSYIEKKIQIL